MKTHVAFLLFFTHIIFAAQQTPKMDVGGIIDEIAKKLPPRANQELALQKTKEVLGKYGITRGYTVTVVALGVPIFGSYKLKRPKPLDFSRAMMAKHIADINKLDCYLQ